jgi:hypothetical protein
MGTSPSEKNEPLLDEGLDKYRRILAQDFSFGAWDGDLLVGISVAEEYAIRMENWMDGLFVIMKTERLRV